MLPCKLQLGIYQEKTEEETKGKRNDKQEKTELLSNYWYPSGNADFIGANAGFSKVAN